MAIFRNSIWLFPTVFCLGKRTKKLENKLEIRNKTYKIISIFFIHSLFNYCGITKSMNNISSLL